ncbi:hypothetical protein R3P38DRAFT_2759395 [Favolaschia claudopus]|uniref:Uncharacterized protein n=1 Tax=Favolaschia claudopus TaxID=2862362 RepID=A0AAW0EAU4_9AGAR
MLEYIEFFPQSKVSDFGLGISPKSNSRHIREFHFSPSRERHRRRGEFKFLKVQDQHQNLNLISRRPPSDVRKVGSSQFPAQSCEHQHRSQQSKFDFSASAEHRLCAKTFPESSELLASASLVPLDSSRSNGLFESQRNSTPSSQYQL